MSDTQVVTYPHTEDQEMGKVREIFDRALNALVDASTLAKSVEQLKVDLEGLKAQVTHYRNTIANQDDQITRLRQDRDAARTAQYQAEDNQRHQATELENAKRELELLQGSNSRMNARLSDILKERDDAQYALLQLQDEHKAVHDKLDKIKSAIGMVDEPKAPEPTPEPPKPVEPEPVPTIDWPPMDVPTTPSEPPEPTPPESYPQDIPR